MMKFKGLTKIANLSKLHILSYPVYKNIISKKRLLLKLLH